MKLFFKKFFNNKEKIENKSLKKEEYLKEIKEKELKKEKRANKIKKYLYDEDFYSIFIEEIIMTEMMSYIDKISNYNSESKEDLLKLSGSLEAVKKILTKIFDEANYIKSNKPDLKKLFDVKKIMSSMEEKGKEIINNK